MRFIMIKLLSLLALSAVVSLLAACGSQPTTPVWKYQTILIAPDPSMMQHCPVTPPPAESAYLSASAEDKEGMLTNAYNGQTTNVSTCNKQTDRLVSWVQQQKALYPDALTGASAATAASAPPATK
jgi:outer membrane lipopolysaccharide assembly protein LptE/RlpB